MSERDLARLLAEAPPAPGGVTRRWGVVTAVHAGPPKSVDVTVNGQSLPGIRYLNSYTPSGGDTVVIDFAGTDPLVVGVLA